MPTSDGVIKGSDICSQAVVERILGDEAVTSIKIYNTLQSDNFSTGSAGWQINRVTGSCEFQDATIRGSLNASDIDAGTLSVSYLAAGTLSVSGNVVVASGSNLRSSNFATGSAGWEIDGAGDAEFNDITIRGTIYASAGEIGGLDIDGNLTMVSGGVIRTASSGQRVELTQTDNEQITFYNSSGVAATIGSSGTYDSLVIESEDYLKLVTTSTTASPYGDIKLDATGRIYLQGDDASTSQSAVQLVDSDSSPAAGQVAVDIGSGTSVIAGIVYGASGCGQIIARADNSSATRPTFALGSTGSYSSDNGMYLYGADAIGWTTGGTYRAQITSAGNFLVGKTAIGSANVGFEARPDGIVQATISAGSDILNLRNNTLATSERFIGFLDSSGARIGSVSANGTTNVAYNTSSDERLKSNWEPLTGALDTICRLEPAAFDMGGVRMHGLGAQRTQPVAPHAVTHDTDDDWWGINYPALIPDIIAAIQELKEHCGV